MSVLAVLSIMSNPTDVQICKAITKVTCEPKTKIPDVNKDIPSLSNDDLF